MFQLPSSEGASLGSHFFIPSSSLSQRLSHLSNSYQLPGVLNIKQASHSSRATPLTQRGDGARVTAERASTGMLPLAPVLQEHPWGRSAASSEVLVLPAVFPRARARGRVPQPRCCSVTRTEQDEAAGMPREPPRHRITRCSPAHRAPARRGSASPCWGRHQAVHSISQKGTEGGWGCPCGERGRCRVGV